MKNNWRFILENSKKVPYFTIPSFNNTNLVLHCFTTKLGGVSPKPYESLNFGIKTLDNIENIRENYSIISSTLGINTSNIVIPDQVHGDRIVKIQKKHKSNNDFPNNNLEEVDGIITNEKEIALVTLYADCVPLFFLDPKLKTIGLSHAGWKGTVKNIGKKTIENMKKIFNLDTANLLIGIGPSIGPCCYEVDEEIIVKFNESYKNISKFVIKKNNGKYMLNLWEANKISLLETGVKEENITTSNICTRCNNKLFYSYRNDDGITGRMAGIIQLK